MILWLKHFIVGIFLLIVLATGILLFFISTEIGLKFAATQAQYWIPHLSIGNIRGRLIENVSIQNLTYKAQDTQITVKQFKFSWEISALLNSTLHISQFYLNQTQLRLPASPNSSRDKQPITLPDIQLPIKIVLDDAQVHDFTLIQPNADPIVIDRVILQASATDNLSIPKLQVDTPLFDAHVKAKAQAGFVTPHPVNLTLEWSANLPDPKLPLSGQAEIEGDLKQLLIKHQLKQPIVSQLQTQVTDVLNNPRWQAQLNWQKFAYPFDNKKKLVNIDAGQLQSKGNLENYQLSLKTGVSGPTIPKSQWQLQGNGNVHQFNLQQLQGNLLSGLIQAKGEINWQSTLQANVQLNAQKLVLTPILPEWDKNLQLNSQLQASFDNNLLTISNLYVNLPKIGSKLAVQAKSVFVPNQPIHFNAKLNWEKLAYPLLAKEKQVSSPKGQTIIQGTPEKYTIAMQTMLEGKDIPKSNWQLTGDGNAQSFNLAGLTGQLLDGNLQLQGNVSWQPHIAWQFDLTGKKLNPGKQWQDVPGRLNVAIHTDGKTLANNKVQANVNIQEIKGKLRDYPLNLQTQLSIADNHYELKNLTFQSGKNKINAKGVLDKTVDLQWQIEGPNLSQLLPQLKGSLQGHGSVEGALETPTVIANLEGKQLQFVDNQLKNLTLNANIDLKTGKIKTIDLNVNEIKQAGSVLVKNVAIQAEGSVNAHHLDMKVATANENLDLQLKGGVNLDNQTWQGQLQRLNINTKQFRNWQLNQPAKLSLSPEKATLTHSCLVTSQLGQICLDVLWDKKAGSELRAAIDALSPKLLPLPETTQITGDINAKVNARLSNTGKLTANADVQMASGEIRQQLDNNKWQTFEHRNIALHTQVNAQGLSSQLSVDVLNSTQVRGNLRLPQFDATHVDMQQPLTGEFTLNSQDLRILPTFVPQLQNVQGTLESHINLGGSIGQPQVQGQLSLARGSMDVPLVGLEIRELTATIRNRSMNQFDIQAGLHSGEGKLAVQGTADLGNFTDWKTNVQIVGENMTVMNTADIFAMASPNINIAASPKMVNVTGKLVIPEANITPQLVAGTGSGDIVTVSEDVIIIDENQPIKPEKSAPSVNIAANVNLILGKRIFVAVEGFTSRLEGRLLLQMLPKHPMPIADGEILIMDGTYKAYGQDLEVDKGRIIFTGNEITSPELDIQAVRYINNPVENVEKAGVQVTGDINEIELTLFSKPMLEDSQVLSYIITGTSLGSGNESVSVGTYLLPKLYVSYGISLFDKGNEFSIRYDLTNRLGVESRIGQQDKGVDFTYVIER